MTYQNRVGSIPRSFFLPHHFPQFHIFSEKLQLTTLCMDLSSLCVDNHIDLCLEEDTRLQLGEPSEERICRAIPVMSLVRCVAIYTARPMCHKSPPTNAHLAG